LSGSPSTTFIERLAPPWRSMTTAAALPFWACSSDRYLPSGEMLTPEMRGRAAKASIEAGAGAGPAVLPAVKATAASSQQ